MSNEYLPEWKPWKVTAEELEKLRAKDRKALEAFYFDNLSVLNGASIKYYNSLSKHKYFYSVEDMLQNVFYFLDELDFSSISFLWRSIKNILYSSCFSIKVSKRGVRKEYSSLFFNIRTILDKPLGSDYTTTLGEILPCYSFNSYTKLTEELERVRQDRIEADLEPILARIFTQRQYEKWQHGLNIDNLRRVLRRHSSELIQFLREHGTPEYKLQGNVLTDEEDKVKIADRRALQKWEEEHLDELDPISRERVLNRLSVRRYRQNKAKKARANV